MLDAALLDATFAAPLRGEVAPWPQEWRSPKRLEAARRRLLYHGICGLLNERGHLLEGWPDKLLATLREESIARAMWEMRHKLLLKEVIEALHNAGVGTVLLKGTALAYSLYVNPALRFRGDSDLLVGIIQLDRARQIFKERGWQRPGYSHGPFGDMHYQEIWQYKDKAGLTHDVDLHWQVTNSMALRPVLDVELVLGEAVWLPALCPNARCADPLTALIHRAVNRAEHGRTGYFSLDRNEYDPDRLIWAVDVDLIADAFTLAQWEALGERCVATGVSAIVLDALEFANRTLGTIAPEAVMAKLMAAPQVTPTARFLVGANDFARAAADFRATPGFVPKFRFVLARAFPSHEHLRQKYPGMARWPLAFLYLRRQAEALGRLFKGRTP